jgi:hypothetical protein
MTDLISASLLSFFSVKRNAFFEFDPASLKHGLLHESFFTDLIQVRNPLSETLKARCVSECRIFRILER